MENKKTDSKKHTVTKHHEKVAPNQQHKKVEKKAYNWPILIFLVAVIALIGYLYIGQYGNAKSSMKEGDTLLAEVNDIPIYMSEIDEMYNNLPPIYQQMMSKDVLLNQTIMLKLLEDAAKKSGISVKDSEVQDILDKILAENQLTEEEFMQRLRELNLTIESVMAQYKQQILITRYLNNTVYSRITIKDSEVQEYYQQNPELFEMLKASHILVESKEEAEEVLDMINKGADFGDMAKAYSIDTGSATNGGDLGYFVKLDMVPEFADAAFSTEVGMMSPITQTAYGFHLIKVTEKKELAFDEAEEGIKASLLSQKQGILAESFMKDLRDMADIVIY